jgi:probable AcnD-accessory protein PrpF
MTMAPLRIPAVYMRGGTSKGVFFRAADLPADPARRERILLRALGSPDPYGRQIDGLGGATSSTSKVVIAAPATRADCDVEFRFGQVAIERAVIDWSGNCGNLTAAVGPFALAQGWVRDAPPDGVARVRIWQQNIGKLIVGHVPVRAGAVVEDGVFALDGVAFPAAEIVLEFRDPGGVADESGARLPLFPTGRTRDRLTVPGVGTIDATLIAAGNPTVIVRAEALGLDGTEPPERLDGDPALLARAEAVRARGAVAMGLARSPEEATRARAHTPKIAFVAPPRAFVARGGKRVAPADVDLTVRMLSMGRAHHAVTGTGAVALAAACAVPGTLAAEACDPHAERAHLRLGHASGVLALGVEIAGTGPAAAIANVIVRRSARRLMEGWVLVPGELAA